MRVERYLLILISTAALGCSAFASSSPTETNPGGNGGDSTGGNGTGGNSTGGNSTGGGSTGGGNTGGNAGGSGGSGGGGGNTCTWSLSSNPCGDGFYCNAPGCNQGSCEPIGTTNDPAKVPLCGCDGASYWNAATAAKYGMPIASSGECGQTKFCGGFGNLPCPHADHYCAYDVQNAAGCNVSDVGGECWGMPNMCPQITIGTQYRKCLGSLTCVDECAAIKSSATYYFDNTCPV